MKDTPVPEGCGEEEEPPGLTIAEAAAQLSLHPSTIYRAVVDGHLPSLTQREYPRGGVPATRIYLDPAAVEVFGEWRLRGRSRDRLVARILRDLTELRNNPPSGEEMDEGYWDDVHERLARIARANRHARSESHSE